MTFLGLLVTFMTLSACGDADGSVIVELRTDYRPGVDFSSVRTELGELREASLSVDATDDFSTGVRVAELAAEAGTYDLRVTLLDARGDTVDGRGMRVTVDGTTAVTVEISMGLDGGVPDGCASETSEICNGEDDDCDSIIDEDHDNDLDGFTWCGAGVATAADCDDNDPSVFPATELMAAGAEACDGADNDCDGMVDENEPGQCPAGLACVDRVCGNPVDCSLPSVTCGSGEFCDFDATPPRCVAGGCSPADCSAPQVCNEVSGRCVTPAPLGDACTTDEDCSGDGLCVRRAALDLGSGTVCTQSCCTDAECPAGSICWASGTGVKLCVPPALVATAAGSGAGGTSCTGPAACASGRCLSDATCLGNCGNDADCSSGEACAAVVDSLVLLSCAAPTGTVGQGDADLLGEGCTSRVTSGTACSSAPLLCGPICIGPCRTTADCPSSIADVEFYCGFVELTGGPNAVSLCTAKRHLGESAAGASCTANSGCRDQTCIAGRCADTCCSDADCVADMACTPLEIRGRWETHCL